MHLHLPDSRPVVIQAADLRDQMRRDVLGGYFDDDAILTNAHDLFEEELPRPTLRREASVSVGCSEMAAPGL